MDYPTIILIRHGETIWNREGRFQGRLNSPLTENGQLQAKNSAKKLKDMDLNDNIKIFASPLGRAKETAHIIVDELGIDRNRVIFDNRIIEFDYGVFEGKKRSDISKTKEFKAREANKWSYKIENGESYEIVNVRVEEFLNSIRDEEMVIIIAHEMVNRTLRGVYLNLSHSKTLKLKQPNSVTIILKDGKERLLR